MKYPQYIVNVLLENYSEKEIEIMTPNEVFSAMLEWEGIIGYGHTILGWIEDIYSIKIEEE